MVYCGGIRHPRKVISLSPAHSVCLQWKLRKGKSIILCHQCSLARLLAPSLPPSLPLPLSLSLSPPRSELFLSGSLVSLWFGQDASVSYEDNRTSAELLLKLSYQPHLNTEKTNTQSLNTPDKSTCTSKSAFVLTCIFWKVFC